MITDTSRMRCPEHRVGLDWPEARCPVDSRLFKLGSMPALKDAGPAFDVYDFRPDLEYLRNDRDHAGAHWKVISGLLEFEHDRLAVLGFADLAAGVEAARSQAPSRMVTCGLYFERTLRNWMDFGYWLLARRYSGKLASPDSATSSFMGYSRS